MLQFVIPAKAGIHSLLVSMDSRVREKGRSARGTSSSASLWSNSRLGLGGSGRNADMTPPFVMARVRVVGLKRGGVRMWLLTAVSDGTIPSRGPAALRHRGESIASSFAAVKRLPRHSGTASAYRTADAKNSARFKAKGAAMPRGCHAISLLNTSPGSPAPLQRDTFRASGLITQYAPTPSRR